MAAKSSRSPTSYRMRISVTTSHDCRHTRSDLLWYDRRRLLPGQQNHLDLTALAGSHRGCPQQESFSRVDAVLIINSSADAMAELDIHGFDEMLAQRSGRRSSHSEDRLTLCAATAKLLVCRGDGGPNHEYPVSDGSPARLTLSNPTKCEVYYQIAILGKSIACSNG